MLLLMKNFFGEENFVVNIPKNIPFVLCTKNEEDIEDENSVDFFYFSSDKINSDGAGLFNHKLSSSREQSLKLITLLEKLGLNIFKKITNDYIFAIHIHDDVFFQLTEEEDCTQLFFENNEYFLQKNFVTPEEIYNYYKVKNNLINMN